MSSTPPIVAKPSVTVNDGAYRVERIQLKSSVNSVPSATVSAVKGTRAKVYRPTSSIVINDIRERQIARLAGKEKPDITIKFSDGRTSNPITFTGYMAAPILTISKYNSRDQFTVVGDDSALDGLDMSIYKADSPSTRQDEKSALKPLVTAADGNIPYLAYGVTAVLEKNYEATLNMLGDNERVLMARQHELNSGEPSLMWLHILQNSNAVYETLQEAIKNNKALGLHMTEKMSQIIRQKSSGFWSVLNNLMSTYQLYYKPAWTGSGGLFRADKRVNETALEATVHPTALSLADGSSRILQVGGVVLTAPGLPGRLRSDEKQSTQNSPPPIIAQYPIPILPGYIHKEMPPAWLLTGDSVPSVIAPSELPALSSGRKVLSVLDYATFKEGAILAHATTNDKARGVLTEYCKVLYDSLRLADSTAEITIPLDVSFQVGERYKFKNGLGEAMFEGFLNGVVHSIDLREGKELESFTQLSITHVQY
jgi:hypothetical protein